MDKIKLIDPDAVSVIDAYKMSKRRANFIIAKVNEEFERQSREDHGWKSSVMAIDRLQHICETPEELVVLVHLAAGLLAAEAIVDDVTEHLAKCARRVMVNEDQLN